MFAEKPGLHWEWSSAALGVAYAVPASVVAYTDLMRGVAFAVGVIPAAMVGLAPTRKARLRGIALGVVSGVPLVIGSVASHIPWLAVTSLFVLAILAVAMCRRVARSPAVSAVGAVLLVLSLPMAAVGLSFSDVRESVGLALILVAGSLYAAMVSMLWPTHSSAPVPIREVPEFDYGVRLGAAAAAAAGFGFVLGLEHVGWATAAVLLIMRPDGPKTMSRLAGRVIAVVVGGGCAVALISTGAPELAYCVAILTCVALATATNGSRWYVAPAFTTFLVLLLIVTPSPGEAEFRFTERVLETVMGAGLAWLFGVALPVVLGSAPELSEPSTPPRRTRPSRPE